MAHNWKKCPQYQTCACSCAACRHDAHKVCQAYGVDCHWFCEKGE